MRQTYAITYGTGDSDLRQTIPDFYVTCDNPRRLAELATLAEFTAAGRGWAQNHVVIDSDADMTVATIAAPPRDEQRDWPTNAPAWFACHVVPVHGAPRDDVRQYGNLMAAFADDLLAMVPEGAPA